MGNEKKDFCTDFLFSTPSFMVGAGTVINLAGNYYKFNESATGEEADCRAIFSDWNIIGNDLEKVIKHENEKHCNNSVSQ